MRHLVVQYRMLLLLLIGPLLAGTACTDRQTVTGAGPLPVSATAYPSPEGRNVSVAKSPPEDIQELAVQITNGHFTSDRYDIQSRPTRMRVTTDGGPYTLSIDGLLQSRELTANGTTDIGLTAPNPGEYTMRLSGSSQATAVLNVRPVGGR